MHGTFMEPHFDAVRESVNSIHTLHGVKEGKIPSLLKADEPISANARRGNVDSILKPMSSARSTSEAAKGLGTTDTPPSTIVGSKQGASFAPTPLEGKSALNPWLAVESTFQNNTTEDVYWEPARKFTKSILNNAVKTVMSSNLEVVSSYFGIAKIVLWNAREAGLDTSMVKSTFGAIFEIATKYSEALKVNGRGLLVLEVGGPRG
ncbi:hypothetical protein MRB53_016520 [Persea americana]|uniref:Uncharacterized protein n=1 Tax=Persea americana TaxID=3435 RepID=A0ACC2M2I4_PERAE|nr:hypothetical protein MRB53_016520 [Persea americana]